MDIVTLDFESFWSTDYSLSKMSPLEYVLGDEFEVISCSIKVNKHPTDVFFGYDNVAHAFKSLSKITARSLMVGHNLSGFDAYICAYVFGLKPRMWGCTQAMARPVFAKTVGLSLAKLVEHFELGRKNNSILLQTKGKHLADFTPQELELMKTYNREDTDQCYALFHKLSPFVSAREMWQIDALTRMRVEPKFEVDTSLLEGALTVEREQKRKHVLSLARTMRSTPTLECSEAVRTATTIETLEEAVRADLASAPKFAALLTALGAEVPTKVSPSNPEKEIPALAKSDEAFIALQEHDNPLVAAAARARLAVKSTLLETRINKFLVAARMTGGKLPVPLRYAGADTTGRDSGEEYNCQNLPRINKDPRTSDALRNSMQAPKGYVVVVADLSGIELRVNHFLWKVASSMQLFQDDPEGDLYKDFAAKRYGVRVEEVTKHQRQMGKVCLAEGSLVLTDSGPKPIESVSVLDLVWDGVEWVSHDGPMYMGEKETIFYDGLEATPDHEVWVEDGRKIYLRDAAAQSLRLARTGAGWAPLGFGGAGVSGNRAQEGSPLRDGSVRGMPSSQGGGVRQFAGGEDARVPSVQAEVRGTSVAAAEAGSGETTVHESERSVVQKLRGARPDVRFSDGRICGGLGCVELGVGTVQRTRSDRQQPRVRAGESSLGHAQTEHGQPERLAQQTLPLIPPGPPRDTLRRCDDPALDELRDDGRADHRTVPPPIKQTKRRVWDILNAGPRNRFTANNVLVANCHLGLGFGAGAPTFRVFAKTQYGLVIPEDEAVVVVDGWREAYAPIVQGWKSCSKAVERIRAGVEEAVDPWGLVTTCADGLRLPSGRLIRYPGLRTEQDGTWPDGRPKRSAFYAHGRHKARLTGPKMDENIVQALARDKICDDALEFYRASKLYPQLRVHDELVYVVPEREAQAVLDGVQKIMRTPPKWWPELITWSEGDIAPTYGAAK